MNSTINNKDIEILKARLTVNRIDKDTSMKSDESLQLIINKIQSVVLDTQTLSDALYSVANGGFLKGAQFELQSMLNKDKVSNRELDIKVFRFCVKVWLAVEYDANFAIADFFATWLYRNLPKEVSRQVIDDIYSAL